MRYRCSIREKGGRCFTIKYWGNGSKKKFITKMNRVVKEVFPNAPPKYTLECDIGGSSDTERCYVLRAMENYDYTPELVVTFTLRNEIDHIVITKLEKVMSKEYGKLAGQG